jgi:N,N'-diacetylchitobiose transport system permease protein
LTTALQPSAEAAAGTRPRRRHRASLWHRVVRACVPYALISPATIVIGLVLAYPLYSLFRLSFQHYGLTELIQHKGRSAGFSNYTKILRDGFFWHVLWRTLLFAAVNVGLTVVLGTLIALLLAQLGKFMRLLLTTGLVLVWAMPVVVAVQVWYWMFDFETGVVSYLLTSLHLGDFQRYDWFADSRVGLGVITALIVWGAIPFVAITVYAGLAQVPRDLLESAAIDGAPAWRIFKDVTLPILKPIFVIVTSLSVIWDFQVFNQIWLMRFARPTEDYYLMSVYAFQQSIGLHEYGLGSAIAVVIVLIMMCLTFVYLRQMIRIGEVR